MNIHGLSIEFLKAARDLCPTRPGDVCEFSALGKSVKLTVETRRNIEVELKRRAQQSPDKQWRRS